MASLQQKFDPKKTQEKISEKLKSLMKNRIRSKKSLKFSRNSQQQNPNNCDRALQHHPPQLAGQAIMMKCLSAN